jgi:hypothetical protein
MDVSSYYIEQLQKMFSSCSNVSIAKLDLNCKTDYERIGYERFDSIVAMNCLRTYKKR